MIVTNKDFSEKVDNHIDNFHNKEYNPPSLLVLMVRIRSQSKVLCERKREEHKAIIGIFIFVNL